MKGILLICLLLAGSGCVNNEKMQIVSLIGKQIRIDDRCRSLSAKEGELYAKSAFYELEKPIKIITYMDSSSCTQCALQILVEWNRMLKEVVSDSVGFVTVVYPVDETGLRLALGMLQLENSLLYDASNRFLKDNKLIRVLARNRTFLLDKNNRVILVGEPFHKPQLWELYKSSIRTLIANKGTMP